MIRILLLLLFALSPLSLSFAAEVDVYTGEVVVGDQGAAARRQALPLALGNVLGKYSGLRDMSLVEGYDEALQSASSILVTFYYRNEEREMPDGSMLNELMLVAKFSPPKVDELAQQLALPLWQAERNPLEVWVVIDNGRERQVMPLEVSYLRATLDQAAQSRGQPLVWPEPDEEGMYPVDMQLLWGGYTEDLASLHGVGVLILAARREGLEWVTRANLGFGGEHWAWRFSDLDLETALASGLQQSIDQVALSSAIAASDQGTWRQELTVAGLRSAADYQQCLAYLQEIGVVDSVAVLSARPSAVTFELRLSALPRYLEESLLTDGVLEQGEEKDSFEFRGMR